jgi:hypothetical protein
MVPFPLYHGTSSHYRDLFRPGTTPSSWAHTEAALALIRGAWAELKSLGIEPDPYARAVLAQRSDHMNWQHGELFVTPSQSSAVRYAGTGAAYGGELMMFCKDALERLRQADASRALRVPGVELLSRFLEGGGTPLLIEITNVRAADLLPEIAGKNVADALSGLARLNDKMRDLMGQQTNFRLKTNYSVVSRVFAVDIEEPDDPVSNYRLSELS